LGIDGEDCKVVEEADGTEVDDWEVVSDLHSQNVVLLLLKSNDVWSPAANTIDNTPSSPKGAQPVYQDKTLDSSMSVDKRIQIPLQQRITTALIMRQVESVDYNNDNNVSCIAEMIADARLTPPSQWKTLWNKDSFCKFINHCIDRRIAIKYLSSMITSNANAKDWIPVQIFTHLEALLCETKTYVELPDTFTDLEAFEASCKTICSVGEVPSQFMQVLQKSCIEHDDFRQQLAQADALFFWCCDSSKFESDWNIQTVEDAHVEVCKSKKSKLQPIKHKPVAVEEPDHSVYETCHVPNDLGKPTVSTIENMEVDNIKKPEESCDIRRVLLGERRFSISQREYFQIGNIIPIPQVLARVGKVQHFVGEVLPYLLQRVKMRGCRVLQANRITELVLQVDGNTKPSHDLNTPDNSSMSHSCSVSRIDCVSCIFNVVDSVVASDILSIMAQFPLALPLVIPNLDNKSYRVLTPLLGGITVKWESGKIIENSLFRDTFKLLVAVRIGENEYGKSTILNQLFSTENMFASVGEPGSEFGRPKSLDGTIELVCLTQEACKDTFWKHSIMDLYTNGRNEVLLLANIHGDIASLPQHIDLMNCFSCHYLVFIMPNCSTQSLTHFVQKVGPSNKITSIKVDPRDYNDMTDIKTSQLIADKMVQKVRNIVKEALQLCQAVHHFDSNAIGTPRESSLVTFQPILTAHSQKIVDYVTKQSCKNTKLCLYLQLQLSHRSNKEIGTRQSKTPHDISKMFMQTFQLPPNEIEFALLHLEKELSRLSNSESSKARGNVALLKASLQKEIAGSAKQNIQKVESLKQDIKNALEEVDSMNLGLEHFFRELAQLYTNEMQAGCKTDNILKLPRKVAELFLKGHPLELLDGDAGDMASVWFSAICSNIDELFPGLRVFVVSILGLQSSGKSTLLNSLFACRFAVSVGRCSRGLYMRLLLLDKTIRPTHKYDAILLIDTEGLGSPEKMNDPDADKKDRLLATFAMGISNLTIINVLGENMKDLTEILQIAVVTLARLEKADISPDIIMVQHLLTEKNSEKTSMSEEQFCDAIRRAIDLAEKKDMQVGVRNAKCLRGLFNRIQDGTLLVQFHPYKDGATVSSPPSETYHNDVIELYMKILASCQRSKSTGEFRKWHSLVESYWEFVSAEDFALRFKNVNEIYDFIDRGHRIGHVKEALSEAFNFHNAKLKTYVASKAREQSSNINKETLCSKISQEIRHQLDCVPDLCKDCPRCTTVVRSKEALYEYVRDQPHEQETLTTITTHEGLVRETNCVRLIQMFNAAIVQQGCCSDFDNEITSCLNKFLTSNTVGQFTPKQKEGIVKSILDRLKTIAINMETNKDSVHDKFTKELRKVYERQPTIIQHFGQLKTFHEVYMKPEVPMKPGKAVGRFLKNIKNAFLAADKRPPELCQLEVHLTSLPAQLIKQNNYECFEIGIVESVNKRINGVLEKFEKEFHRLETFEKVNAHLWTQQLLYTLLNDLQDVWDKQNKPLMILQQNEQRYREIINTRLEHGFSCVSESYILGNALFDAVTRKGIEHASAQRIRNVKGVGWITCSETVRLQHILELADEVSKGNKTRAIQYFTSPQTEIERWFRDTVDGFADETTLQGELDNFCKAELKVLMTKIRQAETTEQIFLTAKAYIESVNTLPKLQNEKLDNLNMLKDIINHCLDKGTIPTVNKTNLSLPSNDSDVMGYLGCTESCFWCGALCWGQRNHSEDDGDTQMHHSSHQPSGLRFLGYRGTNTLSALPCHDRKDDTKVWFGKFTEDEDGIPWITAKLQHFPNWKFDRHYRKQFDEIMRWFFQELHKDLASLRDNRLPATESELQKHKCVGLKYEDIRIQLIQAVGKSTESKNNAVD